MIRHDVVDGSAPGCGVSPPADVKNDLSQVMELKSTRTEHDRSGCRQRCGGTKSEDGSLGITEERAYTDLDGSPAERGEYSGVADGAARHSDDGLSDSVSVTAEGIDGGFVGGSLGRSADSRRNR